jgi:hypothetical protein
VPSEQELEALVGRCTACGHPTLRARAMAACTLVLLDGEPVGAGHLDAGGAEPFAGRVYRVECAGCGRAAFERSDCPLCGSRGGLERALAASHGLSVAAGTLPRRCPHCGGDELAVSASARAHALYVHGALSRRVVDAEPHEPGFHLLAASCPTCDQQVAEAPAHRCAVCGRSSLVRR